jgi:hypothetical protein
MLNGKVYLPIGYIYNFQMSLNESETKRIIKKFKLNRTIFRWLVFSSIIGGIGLGFILKNNYYWSRQLMPLLSIEYFLFISALLPVVVYIFCRYKLWKCPSCNEKLEIGNHIDDWKTSTLKNCYFCGVPFEYGVESKIPDIEKIRRLEIKNEGISYLWKSFKIKKKNRERLNKIRSELEKIKNNTK